MILFSLLISFSFAIAQAPTRTAGDELIKAKNNFLTGVAVSIIGGGLGVYVSTSVEDQEQGGLILAGLSGVVGLVCIINGAIHIGKAGKSLNEKKIGFISSQNGIGLRYALNGKSKSRINSRRATAY